MRGEGQVVTAASLELGTAYCGPCGELRQVVGEQAGIEGVKVENHHERTYMLTCGHTARVVTL